MAQAKGSNGTAQTPEQVAQVLAQVQKNLVKKPPVVEAAVVGRTKTGAPASARNVSTVARMMLIQGFSNAEVFAALQAEFNLPLSRKGYPAWYRAELTREGVLTGSQATTASGTPRASKVTSPKKDELMSIAQNVDILAATLSTLNEERSALRTNRAGLQAAQKACCESMKLKTKEEQETSPVYAELAKVDARMADLDAQAKDITTQHEAMVKALAAYNEVMNGPAKTKAPKDAKLKVVAPKAKTLTSLKDLKTVPQASIEETPAPFFTETQVLP